LIGSGKIYVPLIPHSDPAESVTAPADSPRALLDLAALERGALTGARIGALRQAYDRPTLDPEVRQHRERALQTCSGQGPS